MANQQFISKEGELILFPMYCPVDDSTYGQERKSLGRDYMIDANKLSEIAKEQGYEMPAEAFIHNYESWRSDFKSNFNHNGLDCFTPCKCNNLSYTIKKGNTQTYFA